MGRKQKRHHRRRSSQPGNGECTSKSNGSSVTLGLRNFQHKGKFSQTAIGDSSSPVVTRAAEKVYRNQLIGLICPFLPPRIFVKCPSIRKIDGRGGGDRTHDLRLKRPLLYH